MTVVQHAIIVYLKENQREHNQLEVHLDRISHRSFLTTLKNSNAKNQATQKFLLCKAAVERKRMQAEHLKNQGVSAADIERMIIRLEASMAAHKKAMARNAE